MNQTVAPRELATTFVGAVTEAARALAEQIERELRRDESWSEEPRPEILWTSLGFVLHLTDRIAFARLSSNTRDVFMSTLLTTLASGGGEDELRAEYRTAQRKYSPFKELLPEK